ncbi:MAG: hypothetical protein WAL84_01065 [Candidatus Dormiibacterota bacterium]
MDVSVWETLSPRRNRLSVPWNASVPSMASVTLMGSSPRRRLPGQLR